MTRLWGGTLTNGISALLKEAQKGPSSLLPCEHSEKTAAYELGSGPHQTAYLLVP